MSEPAPRLLAVAFPQRRGGCGFTLFEFAVVAVVFSVLVGVLLQRLAFYQGEAERAGAQLLVTNMQSALRSKAYEAAMRGKPADLAALVGTNPINWLSRPPENYGGEIDTSTAKSLAPGYWYFDRGQRILIYVFSGKKSFPGDAYERWCFRVKFTGLPTINAKPDGTQSQEGSVALIQVDASQPN
jgi:type II secretory pathway pseudopilin PulG